MTLAPDSFTILLMAYGSPNSVEEVGDYLTDIRGGRKPTMEEVERLKERYRRVGGKTPLLKITNSQARALEDRLLSENIRAKVYVGMKHWRPFIRETVSVIVAEGSSSILGVALAPHYSRLGIGGYEGAVERALGSVPGPPSFRMVRNWHDQPALISAWSRRVREGLRKLPNPSKAIVLFTAHSLPKRMVSEDDPYQIQLSETCRLVAREAGLKTWDFAFQSAGNPREDWLGPHLSGMIADLAGSGVEEILVCPVGFVSDHLEILYDLDVEAKEQARSLGARLERTASLNDDPEFIAALVSVVRSNLAEAAEIRLGT